MKQISQLGLAFRLNKDKIQQLTHPQHSDIKHTADEWQ